MNGSKTREDYYCIHTITNLSLLQSKLFILDIIQNKAKYFMNWVYIQIILWVACGTICSLLVRLFVVIFFLCEGQRCFVLAKYISTLSIAKCISSFLYLIKRCLKSLHTTTDYYNSHYSGNCRLFQISSHENVSPIS